MRSLGFARQVGEKRREILFTPAAKVCVQFMILTLPMSVPYQQSHTTSNDKGKSYSRYEENSPNWLVLHWNAQTVRMHVAFTVCGPRNGLNRSRTTWNGCFARSCFHLVRDDVSSQNVPWIHSIVSIFISHSRLISRIWPQSVRKMANSDISTQSIDCVGMLSANANGRSKKKRPTVFFMLWSKLWRVCWFDVEKWANNGRITVTMVLRSLVAHTAATGPHWKWTKMIKWRIQFWAQSECERICRWAKLALLGFGLCEFIPTWTMKNHYASNFREDIISSRK